MPRPRVPRGMQTVIHLTSAEPRHAGHAMRSAALLRGHDDLPHDEVTLVTHRDAVALVAPDSTSADEVADLLAAGVRVAAGATCFDATGRPREALPGVTVVPSGVAEVVRLQAAGANYVKVP